MTIILQVFSESVRLTKQMKAYHGTNIIADVVPIGRWITLEPEVAYDFACEKAEYCGGTPVVLEIDIEECDVDWDVLSMGCGVEDERGTLVRSIPATPVEILSRDRRLSP